jgi:hypothetical protein
VHNIWANIITVGYFKSSLEFIEVRCDTTHHAVYGVLNILQAIGQYPS